MDPHVSTRCTAFLHGAVLGSGPPADVLATLGAMAPADRASAIVLDDPTGRTLELWSGDAPALPAPPPAQPRGRPKLGVAAREVTLLPRHWEWLARQPGGASATLRKLVEAASRDPTSERREARDALHRAMGTLAGDRPGYEDAARALFAGDRRAFANVIKTWPQGIADFLAERSIPAFEPAG